MTLSAYIPWRCCAPGPILLRPLPRPPSPPLLTILAEQLVCLTVGESKQAQEGGAEFSVMAHLQALPCTPAFTLSKDTQGQVLNPHKKIKPTGQQSIRTGTPLSVQAPFHLSLCSRMQQYHLSFKTQIPKVFLMLWSKI